MSRPIVPLTVPQAHHFKTDRRAKLSISYKIKGKSKVKASFNDAEKEIEVPGNKNIWKFRNNKVHLYAYTVC